MNLLATRFSRRILTTAFGIVLLAAATTVSALTPNEPLATFSVSDNEARWEPKPNLRYQSMVLTVSTPENDVVSQTFPAGSRPYFETQADGVYTYELYMVPVAVAKSANNRAATKGAKGAVDANGRRHGSLNSMNSSKSLVPTKARGRRGAVQSGHFRVVNGQPLDSALTEEPYSGRKKGK